MVCLQKYPLPEVCKSQGRPAMPQWAWNNELWRRPVWVFTSYVMSHVQSKAAIMVRFLIPWCWQLGGREKWIRGSEKDRSILPYERDVPRTKEVYWTLTWPSQHIGITKNVFNFNTSPLITQSLPYSFTVFCRTSTFSSITIWTFTGGKLLYDPIFSPLNFSDGI